MAKEAPDSVELTLEALQDRHKEISKLIKDTEYFSVVDDIRGRSNGSKKSIELINQYLNTDVLEALKLELEKCQTEIDLISNVQWAELLPLIDRISKVINVSHVSS